MTIQTDGRISLNADAGDILAMLGAKYAQILWDKEASRMALRPLKRQDRTAFKLTFWPGKRGSLLSARSFLNSIQWQNSDPFTTEVHWNEKDGLFEAVLPPGRVGSRKQK